MIVVKLGGRTFETPEGRDRLLAEVAELAKREKVIVVHGGGNRITAALQQAGVQARFVRGLRVTDEAALRVAERTLRDVGQEIAAGLAALAVPAQALAGCDDKLLEAEVRPELGLVGQVRRIQPARLLDLVKGGTIPVVAPLAWSREAPVLNVNADEAAGALAAQLPASALLLLTDVDKVVGLDGPHDTLSTAQAQDLLDAGLAKDGMAPKLEAAIVARQAGCSVTIANGNRPGVVEDAFQNIAGTKVV